MSGGKEHSGGGEHATHAANGHSEGRKISLGKRFAYVGFGLALLLPLIGAVIGSGGLAGWGFLGGLVLGSGGLVGHGLSRK